jgi:murein DD-endopeptidase MepM/ murein hydrolase activator NlpD
MRFRHPSLVFACVILLSIFFSSAAVSEVKKSKKSAKELRHALQSVKAKIHEKKVAIRETKRKERNIASEIATVEERMGKTEDHLARVKDRLEQIDARQKLLTKRMAATERRLEQRRRVLAKRLRDNYERGNTTYMQVLLASRSVHDYVSRSYYVERIVESDVKLVAGIKADRKQLDEDKRELDKQQSEQGVLRENLEIEHEQYKADVGQKQKLLEEVQDNRENLEEALNELEQSSNEIEALIRAQQETPRGRARMLKAWTGHFIKPAGGPITSGFGYRFHPILHRSKMHTGVDIGAGYGSTIHAAAAGDVIFAGYRRGYGNTVVIDHGGGVSTLYGHCSALTVSEGQSVTQGQPIARVGSTGMSTGPHLHFEVRRNGTPVSPM